MKRLILMTTVITLVALPASLMAMSHEKHEKMGKDHSMHGEKMKHDKMDHGMDHGKMDHDAMMKDGDMKMLGSEVKKGVKARVHIKDVSEAMAKMGMDHTHHLMVSFVKDNNGAEGMAIEKGAVAVKVINPDESESKPVKMIGMEGHFGADLALQQPGLYHFRIGTKLEDGKKRQYHFHVEVE